MSQFERHLFFYSYEEVSTMVLPQLASLRRKKGLSSRTVRKKWVIIFTAFFIFVSTLSFAGETMKYQVVAGSDDKAYLVDTTTGYVWVLTYRTLATGREPIAIPYKFIKLAPKGYPEFLIENIQGVSMPPGGKP
jgi:putative copper export protein